MGELRSSSSNNEIAIDFPMNLNYYFSDMALQNINEINDYLFEQYGVKLSNQFLNTLLTKCDRLTQFLQMGCKRDELSISLRSFLLQDYLIFYRITSYEIEIVRVVSGHQIYPHYLKIESMRTIAPNFIYSPSFH